MYKKLKTNNQYLINKSEIYKIEDIIYNIKKRQFITDNELIIVTKIFQNVISRDVTSKTIIKGS
jgi:hypothetical protein